MTAETRTHEPILDRLPPVIDVSAREVAVAASTGRRLVILDDDPTGTQAISELPIVTAWATPDLRWALDQDARAFFILTNTRSLAAAAATARNREIMASLATVIDDASSAALVSRSDSTLRGHFPLETDLLVEELNARSERPVDGVVIVPAFIDAGRITLDSTHWVRTPGGFVAAGESEFAHDPAFGYTSSDLRDWVAEKTLGRWQRAQVARITLSELRSGVPTVTSLLRRLREARPVVVDAVADQDLRVLALASIEAEEAGSVFVYRVGPSFVRARTGQEANPPLSHADIADVLHRAAAQTPSQACGGLVVVGSYVGLTTRQLAHLEAALRTPIIELELPRLLSEGSAVIEELAKRVVGLLARGDVVVHTSRTLAPGHPGDASLAVAARVSDALVALVRRILDQTSPRWIVAKGGITSSEIATRALGIRRAWARGTMLPGIVSLWEPVGSPQDIPYIVFPGNVGETDALTRVVEKLQVSD